MTVATQNGLALNDREELHRQLDIHGGIHTRLSDEGYTLPRDLPPQVWFNDGEALQIMEQRVGFWIGDWLRAGYELYGEDLYNQALKLTHYARQTLKNARNVAGAFAPERRRTELSYSHHAAVAALPEDEQDRFLDMATPTDEHPHGISSKDLRDLAVRRAAELRRLSYQQLPVPQLTDDDIILFIADATDLPLPDKSVNLIITSPPYALEKEYEKGGDVAATSWWEFMCAWTKEAYRVTAADGRMAMNVPLDTTLGGRRPTHPQAVAAAQAAGWKYYSSIIWHDDQLGKSNARGSYDAIADSGTAAAPSIITPAEMIILLYKGDWWRETPQDRPSDLDKAGWLEWTNGFWHFPGESNPWEYHPAPFPVELPRRLVYLLSFPGDVVCDPFLGSGTVAVAARDAGRRVVGSDLSGYYVASSQRRLMKGRS